MIARAVPVPKDTLLIAYAARDGVYTDCFEVMHPLEASLQDYIAAFYTTWIFRLERIVLSLGLRRRISDDDVQALAEGAEHFAAWTVEARVPGQILLRDLHGRTRSYLAVAPKDGGTTRLVFGSAVVPNPDGHMPFLVRALVPAHQFYSKLLLRAAERNLRRG